MSAAPTPPPHVLFVSHAAVLGGGELSLVDLARGMPGRATVALLADGPLVGRLEEAGVPVRVVAAPAAFHAVRREGRGGTAAAAAVASLVLRLLPLARRHDVLYANSMKALPVAGLLGYVARRPVVWHLRDLLTDAHFSLSQQRLAVGLARRFATQVVANSGATRDAFAAAGGDARGVRVVYSGIDLDAFSDVPAASVARLRREVGLGDAPTVGVFSRLAPWKGQHVLVEALAGLPAVHALIVGEALFAADGGVAGDLAALAERLGVADRVHRLGARRDVAALMHACTIVAHTSISAEPFGRVIAEGMAAGRPVVATAAGGALELVEHGRTGVLVPPGDGVALGDAIGRLLADPVAATELARRGQADARRRMGSLHMQAAVRDLVGEVAASRH